MDLRDTYTLPEIEEIVGWFESHEKTLPREFHLEKAVFFPNFGETVKNLCMLAQQQYNNPTFGAQIGMLFRIREKLQSEDKETAENPQ